MDENDPSPSLSLTLGSMWTVMQLQVSMEQLRVPLAALEVESMLKKV